MEAGAGKDGIEEDEPRKRLTAEARRQVILDAALDVYATDGFNEASLDTVARRAGVSKALIYEHFASKQELHSELLELYVREMLGRVDEAIADQAEPEVKLLSGLRGFLEFVESRRDAWRMLVRNRSSADVAESFERLFSEVAASVANLISENYPREVVPEGLSIEAAVEATARQLMGAVISIADWWDEHRDVSRDQVLGMVMDFAWVGLERGSAGETWPGRA